ncbi:uncharacterized protein ACDP82_001203 [Pangshura tecta]
MEEEYTSNELPEVWKTEFTKQRPIIPVVFQVAAAIAMFVLGCFAEAGIGAPWWCAIMFLIFGLSLLILVKKHSVPWEKCAFVTIILSIITAVAGTIYYSLEFSLIRSPQSPFPHDISDPERLARAYRVQSAELGLAAFELGVSVWIFCLLQQARKTLRQ